MEFTLRQAICADECQVARELFLEYAAQLGHDLRFQNFSHELETLPGAYAPPAGALLLARTETGWAGCVAIRCFSNEPRVCEMKRLFVRPPYRRLGLGRRLAKAVIAAGRAAGYAHMRLDTLAGMTVARGLYTSIGFREIAPYYHNPLHGVVFYELNLAGP